MQPLLTRVLIDMQIHTHNTFTLRENTHTSSYYPQCLLEKFYIGLYSFRKGICAGSMLVLVFIDSTRKTRNVKHSGLSSQKETCSIFSTQKTGDRTDQYPGDLCTSGMPTPH